MDNETFWGLNLDNINPGLFEDFECVQEGKSGHTIAVKANYKKDAARWLSNRVIDFIDNNIYPCDEHGNEV